ADLDRAATLTAAGAFRFAGQKCTASSRVIVDMRVMTPFAERLEAATRALRLGPVTADDSAVGPLVSAAARDRVTATLDAAGRTSDFGALTPSGSEWEHGNWLQPQFIRLSDSGHQLAREELFAPVLVALESDSLDHAITLANDTAFGLSASLFTRDLHAAFE